MSEHVGVQVNGYISYDTNNTWIPSAVATSSPLCNTRCLTHWLFHASDVSASTIVSATVAENNCTEIECVTIAIAELTQFTLNGIEEGVVKWNGMGYEREYGEMGGEGLNHI